MPLGFDHCHRNTLIYHLGKKAAIIVFRAVFADKPDLASMQPAAFKREQKIVFHTSRGRKVQLRTARLFIAVDI